MVGEHVKPAERARILNPLIRESLEEADSRGESLALIRPETFRLSYIEKTQSEIAAEREKHAALANQLSLFDKSAKPLEPCPVQFIAHWKDSTGKFHRHECDDWETSAAFSRFERESGRADAINIIKSKFEDEYFKAGLALAFSTHSRRNVTYGTKNQWLLVGIIRLDEDLQGDLFLK